MAVRLEERVIAKAVIAAWGIEDLSLDGGREVRLFQSVSGEHQGASEAGAAVGLTLHRGEKRGIVEGMIAFLSTEAR
jgi:hypothetical protein